MMPEAGALDSANETCREYERLVDPKYLDQIWMQAKQFSTRSLVRRSGVAKCAIINFKRGKNTIKPRTLRPDKGDPCLAKQRMMSVIEILKQLGLAATSSAG